MPQGLIGREDKKVVDGEFPAGLAGQEPDDDLPRKVPGHRLVVALILFAVLIAVVVSVSVTQTRNNPR